MTARRREPEPEEVSIVALEWVLSGNPCSICAPYGGLLFTVDTHEPIDHDTPWMEGPGLLHPNCECVASPVIE